MIFEPTQLYTARWVAADDPAQLKAFADGNGIALADDHDGQLVFLARNAWHLGKAEEEFPKLRFLKTRETAL